MNNKFRYALPSVSGFMGDQTIVDLSVHPPIVDRLDYEFSHWLGDELLETFPCFIVTERLRQAIEEKELSGVGFDEVIISRDKRFKDPLPTFYWLKVVGAPREDDFGIAADYRLIVSDAAYRLLLNFNVFNYRFKSDDQ